MSANGKSKQRTITLTNAPPVRIVETDWPLIAQSDWADSNSQAKAQLRVRRHEDGRTLVYGTFRDEPIGARTMTYRAGFLIEGTGGTAQAVSDTAARLSQYSDANSDLLDWQVLTDACIANLPVVVI